MGILTCLLLALANAALAPSALPDSTRFARAPDSTSGAAMADSVGLVRALRIRFRESATAFQAPEAAGASEPSGVAADAFGRVYASDERQHRLMRFDARGGWLGSEGSLGSESGQFRRPGAVALHGALEVVVLDRENRRVARYDFLGHFVGLLVDFSDPALAAQVNRVDPIDLASDRGGALAIADREGERVLLFDVDGQFLRALGGFGNAAGSFHGLAAVAFTTRGDVLVTERAAARVQRLESGGRPISSWRLPPLEANGALPIAAAPGGRIAVADERSGQLWLFDASGALLARRGGLASPRALAFSADGSLLVAEGAGARVRRFAIEAASPDSAKAE